MKETIKLFNRITRNIINVEDFYAITIYGDEIRLQGNMNGESIQKYGKFCNVFVDTANGFVKGDRKISGIKINIVLT